MPRHFALAKKPEEQCTAFGQKDVRRCRNKKRDGYNTCNLHKNYYETFSDLHPPFESWDDLTDRQKQELIFQVEHRYIHPATPFFHRETHPKYVEYFMFCAPYFDVPLSSMRYYYHRSMNKMWDIAGQELRAEHGLRAKPDISVPDLCQNLYNCMEDIQVMVNMLMHKMIQPLEFGIVDFDRHPRVDSTVARFQKILYHMPRPNISHIFVQYLHDKFEQYSEFVLAMDISEEARALFRGTFDVTVYGLVRYFLTIAKQEAKVRMGLIKEELMQKAWEPKRVAKWVEADAWDMMD